MVLKKYRSISIIILIIFSLIIYKLFTKNAIVNENQRIIESTNKIGLNQNTQIKINSSECKKIQETYLVLTPELKKQSVLSFENIHVDNHGIIYRLRKFHKNGIQKYYQFNVYKENANEEAILIEKNIGNPGTLYTKIEKENYPVIFNEAGYNHQNLFLFYQNGKIKLAEGNFENQNIRCDLF